MRPLPPYTFIPGRTPHPVSDPAGHMHGKTLERPPAPDPSRWQESRAYLVGVDLFNHGFYWEAHEAWEGLWHACGRMGPTADFLPRADQAGGRRRQMPRREAAGSGQSRGAGGDDLPQFGPALGGMNVHRFGLRIGDLLAAVAAIEALAPAAVGDHDAGVRIVFDFVLVPQATAEV